MHAGVLFVILTTASQVHPVSKTEPTECLVVVEEMGNVGLRISEAQALASEATTTLRERLGFERVLFEGTYTGKVGMKKRLGAAIENEMQNEELAYLKAAIEHAPYRVRMRFGHGGKKAKGAHWIDLSCRKADAKPKDVLEKTRFTGKTFATVRKQLKAALPTFCAQMAPPAAAPAKGEAGSPLPPPKKKKKAWTLPPRR